MSRPEVKPKVRCAIYSRKSSEEGLELAFNSLDAQREACAAYIDSQRHEGWIALDDRYDDGGYSGGTLERPALQRLIRNIEAGRVDTVVCYKIDRLSRFDLAICFCTFGLIFGLRIGDFIKPMNASMSGTVK
jgi:DNA invertase Pin-like site-specific DNA recombinase